MSLQQPMTQIMESMIHHNNTAISSFANHKELGQETQVRKSMLLLRSAIQELNCALAAMTAEEDEKMQQPREGTVHVQSVELHPGCSTINNANDDAGVFCLFDRALTIQTVVGCPRDYLPQVGAVLMYNLGCLQHVSALCAGPSITLGRAAQLYETSLSLVAEPMATIATMGDGGGSGLMLLYLALQNNLGHIHSIHARHAGALECFANIKNCLWLETPSSSFDSEQRQLTEGGYAFFLETVAVFHESCILMAAPAA